MQTIYFFVDERGCQTKKQGGNADIGKCIVEDSSTPQVICRTEKHRFTILPFTSSPGNAVCCVLIFQHKEEEAAEVPTMRKTGIKISVENPIHNEKEKLI